MTRSRPRSRSRSRSSGDTTVDDFNRIMLYRILERFSITFIGATILIFIVILIYRPENIKFHVTEASLTEFNYSTNNDSTLHYNLAVNVSFCNPNHLVNYQYDKIKALALYHDVQFGSQTLKPFVQKHKTTKFVSSVFKGQLVMPPAPELALKFETEKGSGVFSIDLKLLMSVQFTMWFDIHTPDYNFLCVLHVPLKSPNAATSPIAFQSQECY